LRAAVKRTQVKADKKGFTAKALSTQRKREKRKKLKSKEFIIFEGDVSYE